MLSFGFSTQIRFHIISLQKFQGSLLDTDLLIINFFFLPNWNNSHVSSEALTVLL